MKRLIISLLCSVLLLPFVIGVSPSLQWGDTPLKTNLPPVVITGRSTYKIIESRQIPIPAPFLPGSKERPKIALSSISADIPESGKHQPVPKSPGCTYRNAITTKVATIFKKDKAYDQRGKYLFLNRRYTEAIETFQHLINTYPESPKIGEAHFWIGECYFQIDDTDKAKKYFEATFKKYPSSLYADYAVYSLGWLSYKRRDFPKAIEYFKKGSLSYPSSPIYPQMLFWLAESYMQSGNTDQAFVYFSKFLKKAPESRLRIPALFEVARIKFYKKEYQTSKKILKNLLTLKVSEPLLPKVYLLIGWCEYFLSDANGIKTFRKVLKFPGLSNELVQEALYGMSLSALQQGKPEIAKSSLVKLGPLSRWFGEVAIELANYYFNKRDYKKAGEYCAKVFQYYAKTPYLEKAYMILGNSAYNTKDYSHATEYYTRVILGKVEELRPMAIFAKGLSFYQIGSFKEAIISWVDLIRRYPKFPQRNEAIYWIGSAYLNLNDDRMALSYFRQLKVDPVLYPKAMMQLAQYWFSEQAWRKALMALQRFLRLYPRHEYAVFAMGMIGEIYFNQKSYSKATQWLSKALNSLRKNRDRELQAKLTFIMGQIAYRQGDFNRAISYFNQIVQRLPKNAYSDKALYWKSMSYYSMRAYEKAIFSFKTFIKKFPESSKVPDAYLKIADCYYNLKNYALSDAYYRKISSSRRGKNVKEKAAYGRILSLYQRGNFKEFHAEAKKFIRYYPDSPLIMNVIQNLAEYYERLGKTEKEIELLEGYIKSHRNAKQVDAIRFKLAKLYEKKGLYNSALIQLRLISSKKQSPFLSVAEKEMGDLYFRQKLYRESILHYRAYLNSEKPSPAIVKEVKKQLITCLIITGDFKTAERELRESTKAFGIDWGARLYIKLGKTYEKRKMYGPALTAYQIAQKSSDPGIKCESMVYVSDIYLRRKKYDKTLKTLLMVRYSHPECRDLSERALLKLSILLGKKGKKDEARQLLNMLVKSRNKEIKKLAKKALNRLH